MRLGRKLIISSSQFVRINRFILFEICVALAIIFGIIQINTDSSDLGVNVLSFAGVGSIFALNFAILNDIFGQHLFNDRRIWPIKFIFWHVVDLSNKNNNELIEIVFWCRNNCKENSWRQTKNNWFLFKKKDDALLCRLAW